MIKTTLYSLDGKAKSQIGLPEQIFAAQVNPSLMAQAVRVFLANRRQGTAKTKTRAYINRTKAKWFKQKGTGHARHGARSAPIFVGGGIAHGPKPRSYRMSFPVKMKRLALASALTSRYITSDILILENAHSLEPKTKKAVEILKNLKLENLKTTWVIGKPLASLVKAARNLPRVALRNASQLNVYDVLDCNKLIFQEDAIEILTQRSQSSMSSTTPPQLPKITPELKKKKTSSTTSLAPTNNAGGARGRIVRYAAAASTPDSAQTGKSREHWREGQLATGPASSKSSPIPEIIKNPSLKAKPKIVKPKEKK